MILDLKGDSHRQRIALTSPPVSNARARSPQPGEHRFGFGLLLFVALGHHLAQFGFTAANCGGAEKYHELIADRIEYLTNKQMLEEAMKVVSKANRCWRITTAGIDYVDQRG